MNPTIPTAVILKILGDDKLNPPCNPAARAENMRLKLERIKEVIANKKASQDVNSL
jgi:hypothetical protein